MHHWTLQYFSQFKEKWLIQQRLNFLNEFKKTAGTKQNFEKICSIKVNEYISPINFDYTLSPKAIDRIAGRLEHHLEYTREELIPSLNKFFETTNPEKWNFILLLSVLPSSHNRKNKLFAQSVVDTDKPLAS